MRCPGRWDLEDGDDPSLFPTEPPALTVWVEDRDPDYVVLFGPDGEPRLIQEDRPFRGFRLD
jgi:hypothetical protein